MLLGASYRAGGHGADLAPESADGLCSPESLTGSVFIAFVISLPMNGQYGVFVPIRPLAPEGHAPEAHLNTTHAASTSTSKRHSDLTCT
jgi:hypothetical protein